MLDYDSDIGSLSSHMSFPHFEIKHIALSG